jgi:opacity protein-like surface antigen
MKGMLKGVATIALATVIGASTAHAQSGVQFGLGGGANIPLGDFSDAAKTGFHGMALVGFQPATLPIGIQVDGSYNRLGTEADFGDFQILNGNLNGVYTFKTAEESKFRPYLIAGVGVYNSKLKTDIEGDDEESSTDFGINGGAGFNFTAGSVGLFVEGRFHNIFVSNFSDTNYIPITVGVRFGGGGGAQ